MREQNAHLNSMSASWQGHMLTSKACLCIADCAISTAMSRRCVHAMLSSTIEKATCSSPERRGSNLCRFAPMQLH